MFHPSRAYETMGPVLWSRVEITIWKPSIGVMSEKVTITYAVTEEIKINSSMEPNGDNDDCEFDHSFFSELAARDTNDESCELPVLDDVPNTRERPGFGIRELRLKRKMQVAANRDPCPDTRDWSKAKRLRADQKGTVVRNDSLPFDIPVNRKSAAVATWLPNVGLAEVTQMRGNFWRTTGWCLHITQFCRTHIFIK